MNKLRLFFNMDNESIRRLSVLETKLDYLIDHSSSTNADVESVASRVDKLESNHQWIAGGAAVLALLSGILFIAFRSHVQTLIAEDNANKDYVHEFCYDLRNRPVNSNTREYPELCNL